MQSLRHYISYIIAIGSLTFCFAYASLSPWPILPQMGFRGVTVNPPSVIAATSSSQPPLTAPPVVKHLLKDGPPEEILYSRLLSNVAKVTNLLTGSSGSGVIIWSGADNKNISHTFILTNRHVLPGGAPGTVQLFRYLNFRNLESVETYPAFTVAMCPVADLVLVEVLSTSVFPNVAEFISEDDYLETPLYTELFIVGCGLGNPPFISPGRIIIFEEMQLTLNGFSVWGCSGGGVFNHQGKLVSITCQIGMATVAGKDYPIMNVSISIPVNVIREWLFQTKFKFIVNPTLGSLNDVLKIKKYY